MPDANHLASETSPYLLQHVHNPVDWYPWGDEALARAREENKPIFLSIGYSACHWCHVMAHESFENEDIARLLNQHFVNIKVDREERPDLDELYMTATQLMTQSGGWPMSVFLTPELKPFFCGTYFPPTSKYGRPGFPDVIRSIASAWSQRRLEVKQQADQVARAVQQALSGKDHAARGDAQLDAALVDADVQAARQQYEPRYGGFGNAPKFPHAGRLELLLRRHAATGNNGALEMAVHSLDCMARGGVYDQIGGGFHRYSVDDYWLVPHFEKMLYDNAQLARLYLLAAEQTGSWFFRRVGRETLDYVLREMTDDAGGFHSATDADSEGEEGRFFVWTPEQVRDVLGEEEGDLFCAVYGITAEGNFEGKSIPNLIARSLDERAEELNVDAADLDVHLADMRRRLYDVREQRVHPGRDDKVLTAWNGLMLRALATGARVLADDRYAAAASSAAESVLTAMRDDNGHLLRSYRAGEARLNAYLDDYAYFALGLLDLHAATGEARWLDEADALVRDLDARFWDTEEGGYFYTSHDHETLIARAKSMQDGALPSANAVAATAHLALAAAGRDPDAHRARARRILELGEHGMRRMSGAFSQALLALDDLLNMGEASPPAAPTPEPPAVAILQEPPSATAPARDTTPVVTGEAILGVISVRPGDTFRVAARLKLAEGYHVNSRQPSESYLIPTTVEVVDAGPFQLLRAGYPEARREKIGDAMLSVYQGAVDLGVELKAPASLAPGRYPVALRVTYQACDDAQCYPPASLDLALTVPVEASKATPARLFPALFEKLTWE